MPPSRSFFTIALFLKRARFLGCFNNGGVTVRFK